MHYSALWHSVASIVPPSHRLIRLHAGFLNGQAQCISPPSSFALTEMLFAKGASNPEEGASWWHKLTFAYANGLIDLGYSQPLHQEHLWKMAKHNEASLVASRFQTALAATKDPVKSPYVSNVSSVAH